MKGATWEAWISEPSGCLRSPRVFVAVWVGQSLVSYGFFVLFFVFWSSLFLPWCCQFIFEIWVIMSLWHLSPLYFFNQAAKQSMISIIYKLTLNVSCGGKKTTLCKCSCNIRRNIQMRYEFGLYWRVLISNFKHITTLKRFFLNSI